ncbi:hypothetical protein [Acinetobacter gyllenbergii]|uniref:hypothetical protein n=1 Tax=Acinetobacter gyllenbergii TaxID=134534 RepID=UPI000806E1A0|nr:hypothetical protein [Acinetobacter gyllenbergii]OBY75914.1 hypothetical protein NG55_04375 [Acinetobacter gyllenbergii]
MFVQHNEYFINTSNINYFKSNENALKVYVYFGATGEGTGGGMVTLNCDSEIEFDELIENLKK